MWRIAIIAAAAIGATLLAADRLALRGDPAREAGAVVLAAAELPETPQMRLCVGPARVTLGGEPFVGLAFGGDGCGRSAAALVGVRILTSPADAPGTVPATILSWLERL
jgi:hypothetical protein